MKTKWVGMYTRDASVERLVVVLVGGLELHISTVREGAVEGVYRRDRVVTLLGDVDVWSLADRM